jgi:threonine dehydrogenase-like Zn-dependent dehydrogenase
MNGIESMVGGVEGKDILIIGGGPIGLLATAICKAKGKHVQLSVIDNVY